MEFKFKDTAINFSDSLGTITAIEDLTGKSLMAIVVSSYSQNGVCLARTSDMLDILALAYAKARPTQNQQEAIRDFLAFVNENKVTYTEIFDMYDGLLVALQYQGKTPEEVQEIIMGKLRRAEETLGKIKLDTSKSPTKTDS